jgi:hypothetical protein
MSKKKCHRQVVCEELRYIETAIKQKIATGDCHQLEFPEDGRMLMLGGPVGRPIGAPLSEASFFMVFRTNRGDVVLTMSKDQLEVLERQAVDLMDMVCDEQAMMEAADMDAIEQMDELENATSPSLATH